MNWFALCRAGRECLRILGIDYCCGGKKPLEEVCRAKNLYSATVVAMLAVLDGAAESPSANPDAMGLGELCDHIERAHHDWLREELLRLDFMTRKVAAVHGDHEPRLREIRHGFECFSPKLPRTPKRRSVRCFRPSGNWSPATATGAAAVASLRSAFAKLESEHAQVGADLEQLSELTDRYTPPEWTCNTFRTMFNTLGRLEGNMHQHVHQGNNLLLTQFVVSPRAGIGSS